MIVEPASVAGRKARLWVWCFHGEFSTYDEGVFSLTSHKEYAQGGALRIFLLEIFPLFFRVFVSLSSFPREDSLRFCSLLNRGSLLPFPSVSLFLLPVRSLLLSCDNVPLQFGVDKCPYCYYSCIRLFFILQICWFSSLIPVSIFLCRVLFVFSFLLNLRPYLFFLLFGLPLVLA